MRLFWFAAGAGTATYTLLKARRTAEALTPDGIRDRLAALRVGADLFGAEVRAGMAEKEIELRARRLAGPTGTPLLPASRPTQDHNRERVTKN